MPKSFNPKDRFFHKAKEQGYRARSAFKLEEIQERFRVLQKGDCVLDVGAAPGSFLQYIAKCIGPNGFVYGLDLQEIVGLEELNIESFICDITDEEAVKEVIAEIGNVSFNSITSDLSPKTSGIKDVDQARSVELNEYVLEIVQDHLKEGGNLVLKIFTGEDFDPFLKKVKNMFCKVSCFKPKATRDRSRETYIVAKNYKKDASKVANIHVA